MAIIYSYPTATPVGSDTIIGTQQAVDESGDNLTVTFTIASIADYVASSILPSGTANYLPVFSTASTFIDSPIFVNSLSSPTVTTVDTNLNITGGSSISNDLTVGGQTLTDTLEVTTSAEIQGELLMGGAINMSGLLINNLLDPVDAQDAATKAYVDANTEEVEFAATLRQPARFLVPVQPGDPVYVTGYNIGQGRYEVDLAQAGDPARMPAIGVAADTYGTNDNGYIITHGAAGSINTNAFDVGDTVWVGQFGGLTNIRPSGTNLVQNVGIVGKKSGGAGEIEAIALGRTNDVPNIPRGSMWVGGATGVANPLPIGAAGQILVSDGTDVNWQDDDTDVSLTQGSLWIGDAANKKSELAVGSQGQVLVSNGTTAVWQDDDTDISLNDKRIWVGDSSNKQQQSTNIYFDQTSDIYKFGNNHILGLGPSFTFGRYNDASGDYSVALGQFCDATGYSAIAIGYDTQATGNFSFATTGGNASTSYSTAIGQQTYASGNKSVAIGGPDQTIASGSNSFALGNWCWASGSSSVAVGVGTGLDVAGRQTIASGNYSAAFGSDANTNNYNYSTALGYRATNTVERQTALGQKLLFNEYGSGLVVGTPAYNLFVDASGNVVEAPIATSPVGGAGTANYIPLWQDSSTLVDSVILQDGAAANSAISIGVSNTISNQSYSIGSSNTSSSVNSVAIGFQNTVDTKNQNLAVGSNNTVSAGNSQAVGSQNTVLFTLGAPGQGSASSLVGAQNSSDGARVFMLGSANTSSTGSSDVAMVGRQNTAADGRAYAFGDTNVVAAFRAFAIGAANTTSSQSSLLIGTDNSSSGGTSQFVLGKTNDIVYNVGDATFPSNVVLAGVNNTTQWSNSYHFGRGMNSGANNQVLIGHFAETSTESLSYVGIGVGSSLSNRRTAMSFKRSSGQASTAEAQIFAEALYNAASYADDTAAAAGGVELGQLYRTGSIVKIRMT